MLVGIVWFIHWTIDQPAAERNGGSRFLDQFTDEADLVHLVTFGMVQENHLVHLADIKFRRGAHTALPGPLIRWRAAAQTSPALRH
jgi:hypothetical protein